MLQQYIMCAVCLYDMTCTAVVHALCMIQAIYLQSVLSVRALLNSLITQEVEAVQHSDLQRTASSVAFFIIFIYLLVFSSSSFRFWYRNYSFST